MKIVLYFTLLAFAVDGFSQVQVEGQLGGSNFGGITMNTSLRFNLGKSGDHAVNALTGLGYMIPAISRGTSIMKAGAWYSYKRWGIGGEASVFSTNALSTRTFRHDFIDLLVYPHLSYTIQKTGSQWYGRVSAGAYFAFSNSRFFSLDRPRMQFEGDVIPGLGISFGRSFGKCN